MLDNYPIIKKGLKPGKTSVIFAGIHGNETCGILAFNSLVKDFKIESGTVIFQIGNPKAIEKNVRFIEINLNRLFRDKNFFKLKEKDTYEYKRAEELKILLDSADALLDIHSSKNIFSEKFIICEKNSFKISKQLPFSLQVSGFDEYESGGTDSYMNSKNKIGICVECGQHEDPKAVIKAKEAIKSFLIAMNHVSGINKIYKQKKIKITLLYKNKHSNFKLSRVFKDFEDIEKDTLIGYDGEIAIFSPYKSKILFAHNIEGDINQECFVLGVGID